MIDKSTMWHNNHTDQQVTPEHLYQLLSYAQTHAGYHLAQFQDFRKSTQAQLTVIITVQIISIRLFYDSVSEITTCLVLLVLFLTSIFVGRSGINSCDRAFSSFLEHSYMIAKTMYALFPEGGVSIKNSGKKIPGESDESLFVPRYLNDAGRYSTTEEYVENIKKSASTLKRVRVTVYSLQFLALCMVLIGIV